jgi:hypothetical protein
LPRLPSETLYPRYYGLRRITFFAGKRGNLSELRGTCAFWKPLSGHYSGPCLGKPFQVVRGGTQAGIEGIGNMTGPQSRLSQHLLAIG